LLVEAKSGRVTVSARRGGPSRVKRDFDTLHVDPLRQAVRARTYIESREEVSFLLPNGRPLALRRKDYSNVLLIVATLDETDALLNAPDSATLLNVSNERDIPWIASYYHLRAITELVEFPSQLIHFLSKRRAVAFLGHVIATDETDWFGAYQAHRLLDLPERVKPNDLVILDGFGDAIEDYFIGSLELASGQPPPQLSAPPGIKSLMVSLDSSAEGEPLVLWLLDQTVATLGRIEAWLQSASQNNRRMKPSLDCTVLDRSLAGGVTFMRADDDAGVRRLRSYCTMKKYTTHASAWMGVGLTALPTLRATCIYANDSAWVHDDQLESLRGSFPKPQVIFGNA